jgi:acetyltransferase-like isoleucine patch superfamily enzyme
MFFGVLYRQFKKPIYGKKCYIDPTVYFVGRNNITIGSKTFIGKDSWFNVNHRNALNKAIIIDDNVIIGWRIFFSSGKLIHVKSYSTITHDCHFLGAGHIIENPLMPYSLTGVTRDKEIIVGVNCYLGNKVTVMGGVTIGHGSVIGAASLVTKNIPPFSIAVGSPCKVIKRFDFTVNKWVDIGEYAAGNDIFMPTEESYLKDLRERYPVVNMTTYSVTNRFGDLK